MYYYAIENILVNHILLYLHGKLEKKLILDYLLKLV